MPKTPELSAEARILPGNFNDQAFSFVTPQSESREFNNDKLYEVNVSKEQLIQLIKREHDLNNVNITYALEKMTSEEFEHFIFEELAEYDGIAKLPLSIINSLLRRELLFISEQSKKTSNEREFLTEAHAEISSFNTLLLSEVDRDNENHYSSADKIMLAFKNVYSANPEAADLYWSSFAQNLQLVNPKILLETINDMLFDPNVTGYWRGNALAGIAESFKYVDPTEALQTMILERNSFHETIKWISFLGKIKEYCTFWSEQIEVLLKNLLQELADKSTGNKLLDEYLKLTASTANHDHYFDAISQLGQTEQYSFRDTKKMTKEEYEKYLEKVFDFKILDDQFFKDILGRETGVELNALKAETRLWLMDFLKYCDQSRIEKIKQFTKKNGFDALSSFLSLEYGDNLGDMVIGISESEHGHLILNAYGALVKNALDASTTITASFHEINSDINFSSEKVTEALLSRGKDLLIEAYSALQNNDQLRLTKLIKEISEETETQSIYRAMFVEVARILSRENINLNLYHESTEAVLRGANEQNNKAIFLKALTALSKLEFVPEIFWIVNRSSEDYHKRFGFDVSELLHIKELEEENPVVVEFGPGNGESRKARSSDLRLKNIHDFAISDKLYYPLSDVVRKLMNFEHLEEEIGFKLDSNARSLIADYIYKNIVITSGETEKEQFTYDTHNVSCINADPNKLKDVLLNIGEKLALSNAVPTSHRSINSNGEPYYPERIEFNNLAQNVQLALIALRQKIKNFLREDFDSVDVYELIDAHLPGLIIGDFMETDKLANDQIDAALAVRSVVYLEGEQYQKFLFDITRKLKKDGVYIDDSVRENFGRNYRIADLLELKYSLENSADVDFQVCINIIVGPGISGEDYNQKAAPLAFVMSKGKDRVSEISNLLDSGYRIVSLDETANDHVFLKKLDRESKVAAQTQEKVDEINSRLAAKYKIAA